MTALHAPATIPEDEPTAPIPGQYDLFTGEEYRPDETEPTTPGGTAMVGDPLAFPFPDSARPR